MTERETQPTADNKYTVHRMTHTYMYIQHNLHSIHSGINIHVHTQIHMFLTDSY